MVTLGLSATNDATSVNNMSMRSSMQLVGSTKAARTLDRHDETRYQCARNIHVSVQC